MTHYSHIPPYQRSSDTSALAAVAIMPHVSHLQRVIYEYFVARGGDGATRDEVERDLGLGGNTVRPRCRELEKKRLILKTGHRRNTRSGRPAAVYVARERTGQIEMGV